MKSENPKPLFYLSLKLFNRLEKRFMLNPETGESFATVRGYARMCGKSQSTIQSRIDRMEEGERKDLTKTAEVLTQKGLQGVRLINEELITEWLPKDNPGMATKLMKLGIAARIMQKSLLKIVDLSKVLILRVFLNYQENLKAEDRQKKYF